MSRTLGAVLEAFGMARSMHADRIIAAATMAARIASNTQEFLDRAAMQDTPIAVLSGDDEAHLGFKAVEDDPTFAALQKITIVDVGGHSTEIATASKASERWIEEFRHSFPIGTLGLKSTTLQAECPSGPDLLAAAVEIDDCLKPVRESGPAGTPVVLGATGTNLVTLRKKMIHWDPARVHGRWLEFGEISRSVSSLYQLTEAERAKLPGMEEGRGPSLPAGALILERALFALNAKGCFVSVRGWRHALLDREFQG